MDPVVDTGLVTELIGVTKSVLGLFTEFPLNVFITATMIGIGIGIYKKFRG